jgi:hypothetical protein
LPELRIEVVTRSDPVPGALVARLFLAPDDFGRLRVLGQFLLQMILREGIELLDADDGDVGDLLLATCGQQVVIDLAGTQDDTR